MLRVFDSVQVEDVADHVPPVREIVAAPERAKARVKLPPMERVNAPAMTDVPVLV